jgi:hypothetical protein
MTLKPWREIADPHEDVLKGTFQPVDFIAPDSIKRSYGAHGFQGTVGRFPVCSASAIRSRMVSAVSVRARYRASDSVSASKP